MRRFCCAAGALLAIFSPSCSRPPEALASFGETTLTVAYLLALPDAEARRLWLRSTALVSTLMRQLVRQTEPTPEGIQTKILDQAGFEILRLPDPAELVQ